MSIIQTILLIIAAAAVGVADVFLKKAQLFTSPWMIMAVILYLFQIFFFAYLFMSGARLINVGIIEIVLYALIVIGSGVFFFGETMSLFQVIGAVMAVIGVIILNIH